MAPGKMIDRDLARAVHKMRDQKKSWRQIAVIFGHKKEWAYRVWTEYDASTGLPHQTKKTGRSRKTDPVGDQIIAKLAASPIRVSGRQISEALKDRGIMDISSGTIRRRLKEQRKTAIREPRHLKKEQIPPSHNDPFVKKPQDEP